MPDYATLPGGQITGSAGDNYIDADHAFPAGSTVFDNLITTFGGNDTVFAGQGNDTVNLGAGNDWADGGTGNDKIYAGLGNDTVYGGSGNDTVFGNADPVSKAVGTDGNNLLIGGDGNDSLYGDVGADTLDGGAGNDSLFGGGGADSFVFHSGFGNDAVLDLAKGADKLAIDAHINGLNIISPSDLAPYISGGGTGLGAYSVITLGTDTIKLYGVSKSDLLSNLTQYVKIV